MLCLRCSPRSAALLFYALAQDWREVREQPEQLRAMFATGIAAFEMFAGWRP